MEIESDLFPFQSLEVEQSIQLQQELKTPLLHQAKHKQTIAQKKLSLDKFEMLDDILKDNLKHININELFPVQAHVIPFVLNSDHPFSRDICVSAPTGSGKTLTYLIPIMQVSNYCKATT